MPRADVLSRKKMRKGTHSCFECRRRKIRCIFPPESPNVCSECFARGCRCIDQEHIDADVAVDHRKNLRERVSRLEGLVESLVQDRSERGAAEVLSKLQRDLVLPPTPLSSDASASSSRPARDDTMNSILQATNNLSQATSLSSSPSEHERHTTTEVPSCSFVAAIGNLQLSCSDGPHGFPLGQDIPESAARSKYIQVRKDLMALLPSPEDVRKTMSLGSDEWWSAFRNYDTKNGGSLLEFCNAAFEDGSPIGELGSAIIGIGLSMSPDEIDGILIAVERLVIFDDEYAASIEGLECLMLASKCYADVGQPRKAWLLIRRGVMLAQILSLPRNHAASPRHDTIWWNLWTFDRFISLLLGLPYGIIDSHCDMTSKYKNPQLVDLLVTLGKVTTKVIDRTQGYTTQTLESALELDQELESVAAKIPAKYWDVAACAEIQSGGVSDAREAIMCRVNFYQIRIFLHLPFMLQSTNNPQFEYSKIACFKAARDMLKIYHVIRSGNGQPFSECKAVDFLGFTSAIVLVLGLLGYDRNECPINPQQAENDWRLIEISMDIFRRASAERGGKVAAQSYAVLEQLSKLRNQDLSNLDPASFPNSTIVIPYFGAIKVRRANPAPQKAPTSAIPQPHQSASLQALERYPTDMHNYMSNTTQSPHHDPLISYDGFYLPNMDYGQAQLTGDSPLNFAAPPTLSTGWQNSATMDIDQDWNWFLADAQQQHLMQAYTG